MTASLTTVDAALKEDYQPMIREQLNNAWFLLSQIEQNSNDVEGRRAVLSLHTNRNGGVGARGEGVQLPEAGNQQYAEERVPLRYNYGRVKINGQVIEASASDVGAFARLLKQETNGVVTDLKDDVARQLFNPADSSIAITGVTSASTTLVLDTATTKIQMAQFHKGMKIDIGTTVDYDSKTADNEITAVNRTAKTLTLTTATTTIAGDIVTRAGTEGTEITGLREIVRDDGTLFNVDPTVEDVWKSVRLQGTGGGADFNSGTNRTPTETLFEQAIEDVNFESDIDPDCVITSRGVRRNYAAQLEAQKRYTTPTTLEGGWKVLTVSAGNADCHIYVDNNAPSNAAWFLRKDELKHHVMGTPWGFMNRDGSVLKYVHDFDRYEAVVYAYHELTTSRRNAHGVVEDLTEA